MTWTEAVPLSQLKNILFTYNMKEWLLAVAVKIVVKTFSQFQIRYEYHGIMSSRFIITWLSFVDAILDCKWLGKSLRFQLASIRDLLIFLTILSPWQFPDFSV